jgi:23S rRNA pseudouridine2457 synthase
MTKDDKQELDYACVLPTVDEEQMGTTLTTENTSRRHGDNNSNNNIDRHFVLYKPDGYLSQFTSAETTRKNKRMLGELYNFPENIMAIGRLDEPTEGLLLLTTCGKTSELIRSYKVEKEYLAQVDGIITEKAIQLLKHGIEISTTSTQELKKYVTRPCRVHTLDTPPILPPRRKSIRDDRHGPTSWISITLTEGKFRQVRKMTAAVGFPTLRLVRVRIGTIHLNSMKPTEVIEMDIFEAFFAKLSSTEENSSSREVLTL